MKFSTINILLPSTLVSASALLASPRGGNVCTQGLNAVAVPLLSAYQPAQDWCTSHYGLPATVTVTATGTSDYLATTTTTTTTYVDTHNTDDCRKKRAIATPAVGQAAAWNGLQIQKGASAALSTFCSCIESHPTTTVVPVISATTTATITTSVFFSGCQR